MVASNKIYEGDQGQRYKIEAFDQDLMNWRPVAYTNIFGSAQAIAESIVFRPNWTKSRIIERNEHSGLIGDTQIDKEYLQPSTLKLQ